MTNSSLPVGLPDSHARETVARLVVLISGNGSNLQAILDACSTASLQAQVVAVISNKPDAFGLERARKSNVPALVVPAQPKAPDRRVYDSQLADTVATFLPDWIVLAGWMRILTSSFLDRFPNRVLNLHPALPGTFPGTHAIERAWDAYHRGEIHQTGVMVHIVPDEGVDCGPVLGQETVPIHAGDSPEQLETRIHATEHRLLVAVLRELVQTTSPQR
ncbi:MAG: phosphoribosylglycinamide formyltransferase [Chloroflexi bacterium]|nr:phosphoribosylglycinamide formyltransferase [Chloroflexota bacterium]